MVLRKYGVQDPPDFPEIHLLDTAAFTENRVVRIFFEVYEEYLAFVKGKQLLFVMREPCARFYSCYQDILSEKNIMYDCVLGPELATAVRHLFQLPLKHLVKLICLIPNRASDRHFRAQSLLYNDEIERRVAASYLFALEDLAERQESYPFNLFAPLGVINKNPGDFQSRRQSLAQLQNSQLFQWKFREDLHLYADVRSLASQGPA